MVLTLLCNDSTSGLIQTLTMCQMLSYRNKLNNPQESLLSTRGDICKKNCTISLTSTTTELLQDSLEGQVKNAFNFYT